ncbi:Crp/Fnr family transcriptional regulator, partial [Chloroflexota bacterium]
KLLYFLKRSKVRPCQIIQKMAIKVEFLESIPYFSGLSPAELDSIRKLAFERIAEKGEIILLEGEPAEVLYFVASGAVKVLKTSSEGKEQIVSIVRPGESFNDVPVFEDGSNPASAQSMGPVVLYGMKKSELEVMLNSYPRVALNIIRVLADRVRQLLSLVEDLSFRHVIGRVAKIILEHIADGTGHTPRLTQQEMAAMAGTAREVVGRTLKALEDDGVIRLDRHRIVITDKVALKEVAEAPS